MTAVGWIVFGVACLIFIAAAMIFIVKKHPDTLKMLIVLAIACALCVGAYFGANAIFTEKKVEEPVVEEVVETTEEQVEEETKG